MKVGSPPPVPTLYGEQGTAASESLLGDETEPAAAPAGEGFFDVYAPPEGESFFDVFVTPEVEGFFDVTYQMQGLGAPTYEKAPSFLGEFWQSVKEGVSLAVTFDPVKKAEKRVGFAETRMRMATAMTEEAADDPIIQHRAEKMVKKAQEHMDKVGQTVEEWQDKASPELMGWIGAHEVSRELMMDRMEELLPVEGADRLQKMRQQGLAGSQRLLNALDNENVPASVRERLDATKTFVDFHVQEIERFNQEKKAIIDRRAKGEAGAADDFHQLQLDRQAYVKSRLDVVGIGAEDDWETPTALRNRPKPDGAVRIRHEGMGMGGIMPPRPTGGEEPGMGAERFQRPLDSGAARPAGKAGFTTEAGAAVMGPDMLRYLDGKGGDILKCDGAFTLVGDGGKESIMINGSCIAEFGPDGNITVSGCSEDVVGYAWDAVGCNGAMFRNPAGMPTVAPRPDVAEPLDRADTIECVGPECPLTGETQGEFAPRPPIRGVSPDVIDPVRINPVPSP